MCGIFGFNFRSAPKAQEAVLKSMGDRIRHRGPDDEGYFFSGSVGIGNRRLSIIDVAGGHQPFFSADKKIALVQNGEIYNYRELKIELEKSGVRFATESDTEVLLKLYERDGIQFLDKINGMFAIAIFDQNREELVVVRDRLGVKPLYYFFDGQQFVFGSEIKALFAAGVKKAVNAAAIPTYLRLGYLPFEETLFEGVNQLLPGHYLVLKGGKLRTVKWWSLDKVKVEDFGEDEIVKRIRETFMDSIALRMRADVPFGAFLSGGIDSSWTVARMSQVSRDPVKTFTVSFKGTKFDEGTPAQKAAKKFGAEHFEIDFYSSDLNLWPKAVYHSDQPHADLSFLPTMKVSELAAKHVKMTLSGDGCDELFAGYTRYLDFYDLDAEDVLPAFIKGHQIFSSDQIKALVRQDVGDTVFKRFQDILDPVAEWDAINQALYLDTMVLLPGNNLMKPDRMAMAMSLEAREPYMDYRLAELAFQIPGHVKLHGRETKYLIKRAALPELGEDIVYRDKQMFSVPVTEWQGLGSVAEKLHLGTSKSLMSEWLDPAVVSMTLDRHKKDSRQALREIRALISFELWLQIFMSERSFDDLELQFED